MKGTRRDQVVFHDEIQSKNGDPMASFKTVIPKHLRPNLKFRGTSQLIDMMLLNGVRNCTATHCTVAEGEASIRRRIGEPIRISVYF